MTTPDQRGLREILENAWASREQLGQELLAWAARHGEAVREACMQADCPHCRAGVQYNPTNGMHVWPAGDADHPPGYWFPCSVKDLHALKLPEPKP